MDHDKQNVTRYLYYQFALQTNSIYYVLLVLPLQMGEAVGPGAVDLPKFISKPESIGKIEATWKDKIPIAERDDERSKRRGTSDNYKRVEDRSINMMNQYCEGKILLPQLVGVHAVVVVVGWDGWGSDTLKEDEEIHNWRSWTRFGRNTGNQKDESILSLRSRGTLSRSLSHGRRKGGAYSWSKKPGSGWGFKWENDVMK